MYRHLLIQLYSKKVKIHKHKKYGVLLYSLDFQYVPRYFPLVRSYCRRQQIAGSYTTWQEQEKISYKYEIPLDNKTVV